MGKESLPHSRFSLGDTHYLHEEFSSSEPGIYLSGRVRYDSYRPTHITEQEWCDLLGLDVNNLDHMPVTSTLMTAFLRIGDNHPETEGQFSVADKEDLKLAAATHDWGEGIKGCEDITWRHKTEFHDAAEKKAVRGIRSGIIHAYARDETADDLVTHFDQVYDGVSMNRETRLGRAFNAVERLGYMRTGLRAWRVQEKLDDPVLKNSLSWISADVLSNQTLKLLDYADSMPQVETIIDGYREQMTTVFKGIDEKVFDNYSLKERAGMLAKFYVAKSRFLKPLENRLASL